LQKQIDEFVKPNKDLPEKSDLNFYDILKERFLTTLGLYIDEIRI
jgi:hypothetical protein